MIPSDLWDEELTAVANARGVPRRELEALVRPGDDPPDLPVAAEPDPPADEEAMAESAARLLCSAAEALEAVAGDLIHADALSVLVLVAELFDLPPLREWTARFSSAAHRRERAPAAARIMREAAELVKNARSVAVLRGREWEWPELPAVEEPAAEPAPEPAAESVTLVFEGEQAPVADAEPTATIEPAAAPSTDAPPSPAPAAPAAPVRRRALVVDRSAIAASFLARQLAQRGLNVLVVTDPIAAARVLAEDGFDAVFVDEDLPGGGRSFLAAHPEWMDRAVLVGVETGHARPAAVAGIAFLIKPASDDEIARALAGVASRRGSGGAAPASKGDA